MSVSNVCFILKFKSFFSQIKNLILLLGMPVLKDSTLYNCRILLLNSRIILIRPKTRLALNGNYRESRWFTAWQQEPAITWFQLPSLIQSLTKQQFVPFGDKAIIDISSTADNSDFVSTASVRIGFEICEELWHADATHIDLFGKRGCHIILNSSASYWELRKLHRAFNLMKSATFKAGGVYAFSNLVGCDGGARLCFYGRSLIMKNGDLVNMTTDVNSLFDEIQIAVGFIDPIDIEQYRSQSNIKIQSYKIIGDTLVFDSNAGYDIQSSPPSIGSVNSITINGFNLFVSSKPAPILSFNQLSLKPEEEICYYCSLWLWDYLRRCGSKGFIVPLSGGLDSASVACLVFCLCNLLWKQVTQQNRYIISKLEELLSTKSGTWTSSKSICHHLLKCAYLSTRFSGQHSENRARNLAFLINAEFIKYNFDDLYRTILETVPLSSRSSDLGVTLIQQNVQARLRMVLTYYLSEGKRLVLATGNVDEALVGYLTKYDCSSADLNPIGSISKHDLKNFLKHFKTMIREENGDKVLDDIIEATPSAELTGEEQKDEDDLQLTYDELSILGRVRRGQFGTYGPYGVFCKIWSERSNPQFEAFRGLKENPDPSSLAAKVKRFFSLHARNRHKQTILTPALHAETYSPDDNRFDHRQFMFNAAWTWQFNEIDKEVQRILDEFSKK